MAVAVFSIVSGGLAAARDSEQKNAFLQCFHVVLDVAFQDEDLAGSEIDYVDNNMLGAGFAINNPNVKSSCGCGHSHQF